MTESTFFVINTIELGVIAVVILFRSWGGPRA